MEATEVVKDCLEVEQKYRVKSVQQILDIAKELKIEFAYPILEKDIYFDRLHADIFALTDEVLRLRSCGRWYDPTELPPIPMHGKTGLMPVTHVLTFKGQKIEHSQDMKVRMEVEIVVDDALQCCTILRHLGYGPTLSFEKVRRLAKCAVTNFFAIATGFHTAVDHVECAICLDSLDKDNHFLEIEALVKKEKVDIAVQAIEYVAKMFQVEEKELRSYPHVIKDLKG